MAVRYGTFRICYGTYVTVSVGALKARFLPLFFFSLG